VYVLGPKHDPSLVLDKLAAGEDLNLDGKTLKDLKSGCHVTRVTLNQIYLLMGRELCELDQVPAGNMLGKKSIYFFFKALFIVAGFSPRSSSIQPLVCM
jgi:hypothetical protein